MGQQERTEGGDPNLPPPGPAPGGLIEGQHRGETKAEVWGRVILAADKKNEQEIAQMGSALSGEKLEGPPSPAAEYPGSPPIAKEPEHHRDPNFWKSIQTARDQISKGNSVVVEVPSIAPGEVDGECISDACRRAWKNPLSSREIGYLERRLSVKGWTYNAPNALMRAALCLLIRMMGDKDPVVALYAAVKILKHCREIGFKLTGRSVRNKSLRARINKPESLREIDRLFEKLPEELRGQSSEGNEDGR